MHIKTNFGFNLLVNSQHKIQWYMALMVILLICLRMTRTCHIVWCDLNRVVSQTETYLYNTD